MSTFLHVIFDPKDLPDGSGSPGNVYYNKFFQYRKDPTDGVSCFEALIGHGENIEFRSWGLYFDNNERDRNKKEPKGCYKDFAYLEFDPAEFRTKNFAGLLSDDLDSLFKYDSTEAKRHKDNPTHLVIRLNDGLSPIFGEKKRCIGLEFNGQELCGSVTISKIHLELSVFFDTRVATREECRAKGYFSDCLQVDEKIECDNNCQNRLLALEIHSN